MNSEWRLTTKYLVGMGLVIIGFYLLYLSRAVLPLITIAGLIAFLASPIIRFLRQRLKFPQGLAVLVTYLLVSIILLLAPLILVPPIVDAVNFLLGLNYQLLINDSLQWLKSQLLYLKLLEITILGIDLDPDSIIDPILSSLEDAAPVITPGFPSFSTLVNSVGSAFVVSYGIAVGLVGGVLTFVFIVLAAIYMSLDGRKFYTYFMEVVPEAHRAEIAVLLHRLRRVWEAFFRGQVTLMLFIGLLVWAGGTILGLPGAFALGIIAGVLEIIPNLGPFLAAIPAVVVALLQGSTVFEVSHVIFALIIIGFYLGVQVVENNFVVPRVLGGAVDLHPLVVLTGVFMGAAVWGILGALLSTPIIASVREIVRYLYLKMLGQAPYPAKAEAPEVTKLSWREAAKSFSLKIQHFVHRLSRSPAPSQETPNQNSEEGQS